MSVLAFKALLVFVERRVDVFDAIGDVLSDTLRVHDHIPLDTF